MGLAPAAHAQGDRQGIRIIVGFAAGGGTDILARVLAQKLSTVMGTSVVVENITGAGGSLGARQVARSAPDGSTILFISAAHVMSAAVKPDQPYEVINDFTPITEVAKSLNAIIVNPSLKVSTLKEFIAKAKQNPGAMNYGSGGPGTNSHMSAELLKNLAGIDLMPIHYRGNGPQLTALLTGEVQMAIASLPPALPFINDGRLVALAVTTEERAKSLPQVPTVVEAGVPRYQYSLWFGLLAPRNTPPAIVERIQKNVQTVLKDPDMLKRLDTDGAAPVGSSPEEFRTFMQAEYDKWKDVAERAKIKAE